MGARRRHSNKQESLVATVRRLLGEKDHPRKKHDTPADLTIINTFVKIRKAKLAREHFKERQAWWELMCRLQVLPPPPS